MLNADYSCVLCNSQNISEHGEFVEDFGLCGELYRYYENFCRCGDCGYEFVTSDQSVKNLERFQELVN